MKKYIRGLSLFLALNIPLFASALEMNYAITKAFSSVDEIEKIVNTDFDNLNQEIFRAKKMKLQLRKVTRPNFTYQVIFDLQGDGCEPSQIYYEKVPLTSDTAKYWNTLLQMGFIIPAPRPNEPMDKIPDRMVLIPYCHNPQEMN